VDPLVVVVRPFRGHGGKFANFLCQICLKFAHTAYACHFKFDASFHPLDYWCFIDQAQIKTNFSNSLNLIFTC